VSSLAGPVSTRGADPVARRRVVALPSVRVDAGVCAGVALALAGVAFGAGGGTQLARTTYTEIALLLGGAVLVATALLAAREAGRVRVHGAWTLLGLVALAVLTGLSITWSLAPADSWIETNRMLAYLAAFAGALALVRLAPEQWPAVLGGVALACVAVSAWALATKVFPGALAADETYARLRAPYDYWNAVGLTSALGVPPLLWLAAKRSGNRALNALAYPGLGLSLVCLMLAYSRGALLALVVGLVFWFAAVPLRLRAAAALIPASAGAGLVIAWVFAREALSDDDVPLVARTETGHELGVLLVLMAVILLAVGLAVGFAAASRAPGPRARRRTGQALLAVVALVPIVALGALATQPGGVGGQVSERIDALTDPVAETPSNSPSRLTATASVRSRYWREAFDVWSAHPVAGVGAGSFAVARTRYRTGELQVRQAHSYFMETLASLGIAGVVVSLALLAAWLAAAGRATGLRRADRGLPMDAERVGLLTLVAVVVVFGVHSLIDWTWLIPGTAVIALLCAAWVAGRGRCARGSPERRRAAAPVGAHAPRPAAARDRRAPRAGRRPRRPGGDLGRVPALARGARERRRVRAPRRGRAGGGARPGADRRPPQPAVGRAAVRPRVDPGRHGPPGRRGAHARAGGDPAAGERRHVAAARRVSRARARQAGGGDGPAPRRLLPRSPLVGHGGGVPEPAALARRAARGQESRPMTAVRARLAAGCLCLALAGCGGDEERDPPRAAGPSPLLRELRAGGDVLVFRHSTTEAKTDRVETVRSCATQRRLTREGVEQARAIGRAMRSLKVPVGAVRASPFCRARDTARAAWGRVTLDRTLLPLAADGTDADAARRVRALRRALRTPPAPGRNTVLVTHTPNLGEAVGLSLQEGEAAVYRPDGRGGTALRGRILPEGWSELRRRGAQSPGAR
jgi:phosphohistidine phosphatase SixA